MVPPLEYSGFWTEIDILAVKMHAKHVPASKIRLKKMHSVLDLNSGIGT